MKAGLIGTAFGQTVGYAVNYFYSGLPLEPLLHDVEKFCNQYLEYNQSFFFLMSSPMWQLLLNLTGKSKSPGNVMEGEIFERRNQIPNPQNSGLQTLQAFQMILSYYLGDLPKATEMAEVLIVTAKPGVMKCSHWYCSRRFFYALIAMANLRLTHKRKDKAEADKHLKYFRTVVKEGAINLVHKLQLLEAEMMTTSSGSWTVTKNKDFDTILKRYDEAIVSATRIGFLQDAALANYLCFQFCSTNNVHTHLMEGYLKRSFNLWMSWGALAVANSLVVRHPNMFESESAKNMIKDASFRDSMSASSTSGSGLRGRSRFDASLAAQHNELNVQ